MSETSRSKGDRPTVSIIGYGSLLSPNELNPFLEEELVCGTPVRVEGFRRVFNQESVWRSEASDAEGKAVLNAVREQKRSMNGVLIPDVTRWEYDVLRDRERGYHMVEAEPESIEPFASCPNGEEKVDTGGVGLPEADIVLVPTGDRVKSGLSPVPEYIDVCLEGARYWGRGFYEEFLRTTEVRPGVTLGEYLKD